MFSVFCFRKTIYSHQDGAHHKAFELVIDINAFNASGVSAKFSSLSVLVRQGFQILYSHLLLSHRTVENLQRTKVGHLPLC